MFWSAPSPKGLSWCFGRHFTPAVSDFKFSNNLGQINKVEALERWERLTVREMSTCIQQYSNQMFICRIRGYVRYSVVCHSQQWQLPATGVPMNSVKWESHQVPNGRERREFRPSLLPLLYQGSHIWRCSCLTISGLGGILHTNGDMDSLSCTQARIAPLFQPKGGQPRFSG